MPDNNASSDSYNDRTVDNSGSSNDGSNVSDGGSNTALPKPRIEIIVDGNSIYKPGMKTFFVEGAGNEAVISSEGVVTGEFCTCDVVYTTQPGSTTFCTCDEVCTCESVCSCDGYSSCCESVCGCDNDSCSCLSHSSSTCSCQSVSCGSPCACVPVH